ncbi:hypothetical protein D3C83_300900 [compost metagenome]
MARFSQLSVAAAKMAIADSGLKLEEEDTTRIGVLLAGLPDSSSWFEPRAILAR